MSNRQAMTEVQPQPMNSATEPKAPLGRTPAEAVLDAAIGQFKRAGKPREAIEAIEAALLDDPANGRLHWRLGEVYRETKQFREAKEVFDRAVESWPTLPELRTSLALTCQELKLPDEALAQLEELVELRPENAADWNNLGIAHSDKRSFERATECYERAIALDPKYAFAWNNLGNAFGYAGRHEESLAAFDHAIDLRPDYAEAYNNRAVTLTQLEKHEAAIEDYSRALQLRADYSEAHTNRSLLLLLLGQYQAGWTEYEWRWKGKETKARSFPGQRWDGGPVAGKRILIYAEQGLGDTLQFIRYARELKNRGATVYVEAQRPLCKLLSRTPGVDRLFHRGQELPPFDYHVPMLSVPGLLGMSLMNLPSDEPYVVPHEGLTQKWAERLSRYKTTFNIGIAWQGNRLHRGDRKRSIPLKMFAPLAALPGVRLVSLQKGFGTEQIVAVSEEVPLLDLANVGVTEDGFLRTAATVKNLDLIVTADTSVAHLAGAMGLPVWIAMSTACDWRWLQDLEDSPWYPSLRLFRQRTAGDWPEVFARIADAVTPLAAARAVRAAPPAEARERAKVLCHEAAKHLSNKEPSKAQPLLEQAMELDPANVVAHHDLGLSHLRQQQHAEAAACFRRVLELDRHHANASANLGAALMHLRQYEEAAAHLKDAVRAGAASPAVHNNLGAATAQLGDHAAAEAEYHIALRLRPDYPGAHYNLSHALFAQGRLEEAWIEHEWRWRMPGAAKRRFKKPRWGGERLDGRTILLFAEQSLEDAILFLRFAATAKDRGAHVLLECPEVAVDLFRSCPFVDEVIAVGAMLPDFDVQLPLMSIAGLTRTDLDHLPTPVPYLSVDEASIASMAARLVDVGGYRIGVAPRGTGEYLGDRRHDLPRSLIAVLGEVPGVTLVDLQSKVHEVEGGEGDDSSAPLRAVLHGGDGLQEVAAILQNLDLVVAADNAVAHIGGALGADVWTVLGHSRHWRWMTDSVRTPWYPQMRLSRIAVAVGTHERVLSHVRQAVNA